MWWVHAETSHPTRLEVDVTAPGEQRTLAFAATGTVHEQMILGLLADTEYTVTVRAIDDLERVVEAAALELATAPLPEDLKGTMELSVSEPEAMEPGVTLVPMGSFLAAIDHQARIVWYQDLHGDHNEVNRTSRVPLLVLGNRTSLYERDMAGRITRTYCPPALCAGAVAPVPLDVETLHHDVIGLPNGNYAALSIERRLVFDFPSSETDPLAPTQEAWLGAGVVVEFRQDGSIVHRHPLLDILDPGRIGYESLTNRWWTEWYGDEALDWDHANSIWYDEARDDFVVSLRNQDAVVGIDRSTGALTWILAPPANWDPSFDSYRLDPGTPDFAWAYHQHSAELTPSGTLLVFDNGNKRASAYEQTLPWPMNFSRIAEFDIDPEGGTVRTEWGFGADLVPRQLSPVMGDVDYLPQTGNALILFTANVLPDAPTMRIVEVTRTDPARIVFDAAPTELQASYRIQRIPSLYPDGVLR